jgi:hypothetical protein
MAITYPRAMPDKLARASFEPSPQTVQSPESGGRLISTELGPSRWIAQFETAPMREPKLGEWRAWLSSMQNGVKPFYGFDPARRLPYRYPGGFALLTRAGGGSFASGTATSWSVDSSRRVLTLNGLPANFLITVHDYCGFVWDTSKRFLVRALESVTGNGAGVAVFTVEPKVEPFVSVSAVAGLFKPDCVMRIVPGSIDASVSPGPIGRATFQAVQHLEA